MDDLSYLQNAVYDVLRVLERYEHSNGERMLNNVKSTMLNCQK